jgi:hypothetical protein
LEESAIYPTNPNIILMHNFLVTAILQKSKKQTFLLQRNKILKIKTRDIKNQLDTYVNHHAPKAQNLLVLTALTFWHRNLPFKF